MSIELTGVTRRHAGTTAIDALSLAVADREFVALVGPSGSGKTTTLRVIAGLEACDDGMVCIDGRDVSAVPARDRRIGFVFQSYALFRHMTVAENVAFGLRVRPRRQRPGRAEIRARVASLLDSVHLAPFGARYPDQLSGGQRQRVALARALATEPAVLLLDEPFGALDPPVRLDMRRTLRALHDALGLTTVLVTHDRDEAFAVADRTAVLAAGRIQQIGTADELDRSPHNRFVFEFLGPGYTLAGMASGGMFVAGLPGAVPIPTQMPDGPAVALIRPDEIGLLPDWPGARGPGATVTAVRRQLAIQHVTVDAGGRTLEVILPRGQAPLDPGDTCGLDLRLARIGPHE